MDYALMEQKAFNMRAHIVKAIVGHGGGHLGPSLSCTDILAALYFGVMRYDGTHPASDENDMFLLSAGHKALALYAALAEKDVIDRALLDTYNELNSPLPGHPDATKLPGVDFSTGSLGHGLSLGCGLAMGSKMNEKPVDVYVLMGDGEQGEGSVWEAAAFAVQHRQDNLVAIVDDNGLQISGRTTDVLKPALYEDRYRTLGWHVVITDGHDLRALCGALSSRALGRPTAVIAKTIKGKGISFAEDAVQYHYCKTNDKERETALREIEEAGKGWA